MSESENREENRKKLLYRYMGNGMFEPVEPTAENREAEELLSKFIGPSGTLADKELIVSLVAKGLEAEKAILRLREAGDKCYGVMILMKCCADLQEVPNKEECEKMGDAMQSWKGVTVPIRGKLSAPTQPTSGDTAKCPPHRPVGGGEYGSSFHGDIICGDCGKDLSDEPATGAVTEANNRLPEAEELGAKMFAIATKRTDWEGASILLRQAWINDAKVALAALASLSGERK